MTIYLDIPHLDRFGWMRVEDEYPSGYANGFSRFSKPRWTCRCTINRAGASMAARRATSSQFGDTRPNGIFGSILICIASGRRFGRPMGSGVARFLPLYAALEPGFAEPLRIHWDYDPWNTEMHMFKAWWL